MAEHLVKYKLEKFGNGYITPSIIYDGGTMWDNGTSVDSMILVGKANFDARTALPENIIEIITQEQWDAHNNVLSDESLIEYKCKRYQQEADPLFQEAYREKELGRSDKWNEYLQLCEEIRNMTSIPDGGLV